MPSFLYYHDDEGNQQDDTEKREYDHVKLLSGMGRRR